MKNIRDNAATSVACALWVLSAWPAAAADRAMQILGNPSIAVCPTSNCPAPPNNPIISTLFVHGRTTMDANHPEWLASMGLYVDTGAKRKSDPVSGQKVTQYLGAMQGSGAGTAWALNTDSVRNAIPGGPNSFGGLEGSGYPGKPGAIGTENGTIGYELDFSNWDTDSAPGHGPFTVGQYVHAQGSFTSLSALYFDANMAPNKKGWHSGIFFNGDSVIDQSTFIDASKSETSLTILGSHVFGLDTSRANKDLKAVVIGQGQSVCFSGTQDCVTYANGRWKFANAQGKTVFSVDEYGNAIFRGRVTQSGIPE